MQISATWHLNFLHLALCNQLQATQVKYVNFGDLLFPSSRPKVDTDGNEKISEKEDANNMAEVDDTIEKI